MRNYSRRVTYRQMDLFGERVSGHLTASCAANSVRYGGTYSITLRGRSRRDLVISSPGSVSYAGLGTWQVQWRGDGDDVLANGVDALHVQTVHRREPSRRRRQTVCTTKMSHKWFIGFVG